MIGGVTVFALPPDTPLYIDERLMSLDWSSRRRQPLDEIRPPPRCSPDAERHDRAGLATAPNA